MLLGAEYADAVPWLVATGVAFAVWLVPFAYIATSTMPTLPEPGPETPELGPEPPAVANLLVNRCEVTTSAISATLVDLAARRVLDLDQIGDGQTLVRLRRQGEEPSTRYERQVLALARERATDGTVPATELSLGYGDVAEEWWKRFEKAVIEHARELGLVRQRFSSAQVILLATTLTIPSVLAAIALELVLAAGGENADDVGWPGLAIFVWFMLMALGGWLLRGWRETPAGDEVTARWLGVRGYLGRSEGLADAPPAGVAIWDRLLAYALGTGVAHAADAALPIGPTKDDEGWSPQRGLWRQVRIKYPKRLGYGQRPALVAAKAVLVLAGIVGAVAIAGKATGMTEVVATACVLLAGPAVWWGTMLFRAATDFGAPETFEGYVVRVPWHYVSRGESGAWVPRGYTAVDDGRDDDVVRALKCYDADIREGAVVRVTATPHLRYVLRMERVDER